MNVRPHTNPSDRHFGNYTGLIGEGTAMSTHREERLLCQSIGSKSIKFPADYRRSMMGDQSTMDAEQLGDQ